MLVKKQTGKSVIRKSRTREKVTREKVTAVRKTMPREKKKEREKVSALRKSIALLTKEAVKTTTTIGKFIAEKLHMQGALHPQESVHTNRKFIARERSKEAEVGVCHLDALFNEMLLMKQINLTIIS